MVNNGKGRGLKGILEVMIFDGRVCQVDDLLRRL
jgi:hypothetical protein